MTYERTLHELRIVCDAVPSRGKHTSGEVLIRHPDRLKLQPTAFEAGWRDVTVGREFRHLCPSCFNRYAKFGEVKWIQQGVDQQAEIC